MITESHEILPNSIDGMYQINTYEHKNKENFLSKIFYSNWNLHQTNTNAKKLINSISTYRVLYRISKQK